MGVIFSTTDVVNHMLFFIWLLYHMVVCAYNDFFSPYALGGLARCVWVEHGATCLVQYWICSVLHAGYLG